MKRHSFFLALAFLLWITRPIRALIHLPEYRRRYGHHYPETGYRYRNALSLTRKLDDLKTHPEIERLIVMHLSRAHIDYPQDGQHN